MLPETDHHIVVSADAHCGAGVRDYKQYLEAKYHADFDAWADDIEAGVARQKAMYKDMERSPLEVGVRVGLEWADDAILRPARPEALRRAFAAG